MSHLWKLRVTFYVVKVTHLLHKKWHISFRGGWWLKWQLVLCRWRIWPKFAWTLSFVVTNKSSLMWVTLVTRQEFWSHGDLDPREFWLGWNNFESRIPVQHDMKNTLREETLRDERDNWIVQGHLSGLRRWVPGSEAVSFPVVVVRVRPSYYPK